jgi:hypothetical protein
MHFHNQILDAPVEFQHHNKKTKITSVHLACQLIV